MTWKGAAVVVVLAAVLAGCTAGPAPDGPGPNGSSPGGAATGHDPSSAGDGDAGSREGGDGDATASGAAIPDHMRQREPPDPGRFLGSSDNRRVVERDGGTAVVPDTHRGRDHVTVERLAARQRARADALGLDPPFGFEDGTDRAGIGFVHDAVPSSTRFGYGAWHYIHYPGVAVADVDGDGAVDIYYPQHDGPNELWLNRGDGSYRNATERSGTGVPDRVTSGAFFADVDGDGDQDLYVTTLGGANRLFENVGDGRFRDVTRDAGVGDGGYSSSAAFFDAEGDGDLDLYVVNLANFTTRYRGPGGYRMPSPRLRHWEALAEPSVLYRNAGDGTYRRVADTNLSMPSSWNHDVTLVPNPGEPPDLYVTDIVGDDAYFANRNGSFVDVTDRVLGRTPFGSFGATVFDHDGDGSFGLYAVDKHSDMMGHPHLPTAVEGMREDLATDAIGVDYPRAEAKRPDDDNIYGSAFYPSVTAPPGDPDRGDGERTTRRAPVADGTASEVSDAVGLETFLPWAAAPGDVDADGDQDLVVTSGQEYRMYLPDHLLLNAGDAGFLHASFLTGLHPRESGRYTTWFRADCGAERWRSWCDRSRGEPLDGTVTALNRRSSRGVAVFDAEGDGDLDVVTTEYNAAPRLLVNDVMQRTDRSYLRVTLDANASAPPSTDDAGGLEGGNEKNAGVAAVPPDGIGAVVTLHTDQGTQHRFVGGSGYLAQHSRPLYFGLGPDERPRRIEIAWPTGTETNRTVRGRGRTVTVGHP